MNKILRHSYKFYQWMDYDYFIQYLRKKNIFINGFTERENANPYAYGSILDFVLFEKELKELIEKKSIKISRMKALLDSCEQDINSPIVKLTGIFGKRVLQKIIKF